MISHSASALQFRALRWIPKVALTLAAMEVAVTAQGLTTLGSGSSFAISGDGSVIVWRQFDGDVQRWSASTGMVSLGYRTSLAGCSGDGSIVWASRLIVPGSEKAASVWTETTGWSDVPIPSALDFETALAVSDTGHALVSHFDANGVRQVEVYDHSGTPQGVAGFSDFEGTAISGDGLAAGGYVETGTVWPPGSLFRFWRVYSNGGLLAGDLGTSGISTTLDLNEDGSVGLLSLDSIPGSTQALWHRASGQLEALPQAASPANRHLTRMNSDASILVGALTIYGTPLTREALVWTREDGFVIGSDYLEARGMDAATMPSFIEFADVSNDGRILVGADSIVGWMRIELAPWAMYRRDSSPVNMLELRGGGSPQLGGTFEARTTGSPGPFVATAITSDLGIGSLFSGDLHVSLANVIGPLQLSATTGGLGVANYPIPMDTGLVGLTAYLQSASPDATQPGGWSLSNGLKVSVLP